MQRSVNITGEVVIRSFFSDDLSKEKYKGKTMQEAITENVSNVGKARRSLLSLLKYSLFGRFAKLFPTQIEKEILAVNKIINLIVNSRIEERL